MKVLMLLCVALGLLLLLIPTVAVPRVFRALSHKLELRADRVAKANEPDPDVYARALERLYEDGLLLAVIARKHSTHPHLYDRLVAAGVTPTFPRPKRRLEPPGTAGSFPSR